MKICPYCASENIFYSKKRIKYFCEDCDGSFDTPSEERGTRVFISYGHDKNAELVEKIKDFLVNEGYDVWMDTSEIPMGKDWRERITSGLMGSNDIISFLSKHSVRNPGVCLDELRIALCLKRAYLKTILLEDEKEVNVPSFICNTQWLDMSEWENVPAEEWDHYFNGKMALLLEELRSDSAVAFNDEMEMLSQRLMVSDHIAKEQRLLRQTFVGRKWLTKDVQDWIANPISATMMIYGVPGVGKSAFSANLMQHNPDVLAGIFFEWDNTELINEDYVTRLLAYKLASSLPDYRKMLCTMLAEEKEVQQIQKERHGAGLFDWLILNPIQCCIDGNRGTGIVVLDGLDETSPETAELLVRKSMQFPGWIKFLFTARYDETMLYQYDTMESVLVDESLEDNINDLKDYFCVRLSLDDEDARAEELAKKCEGSFMYANTLCDAIENGSLEISDIHTFPSGISAFYYDFFKRLFPTQSDYVKMRPLLELLCIEDELPEELLCACLQCDKYELWEMRYLLKSLVINSTAVHFDGNFKIMKFVHKSIKDWVLSPDKAGQFWVEPGNGYRRLSKYIKDNIITKREVFKDNKITILCKNQYPKWLIKSGMCDVYHDLLMDSFDAEKMDAVNKWTWSNITCYHSLYCLWKWIDLLPIDYPVGELLQKFEEIVLYPGKHMVSCFAHRSFQIIMLTLSHCMETGRFAGVFIKFMSGLSYDRYFRSRASDDAETRDGWDKHYMTRDAVICLKKCDKLGIAIPNNVRRTCELMKLSCTYYEGKCESSVCGEYGILCEPALFKDICILDDELEEDSFKEVKELRAAYNTKSIRFYLANSEEEDLDFIKKCVDNLANLPVACEQAIADLNSEHSKSVYKQKTVVNRIEFIHSLMSDMEKNLLLDL